MSNLNFGLKEEDLIFRKRIHGRAFVTDKDGINHLISLQQLCNNLGVSNDMERDVERLIESGQGQWKDLTKEEAAAWANEQRPWWKKLLGIGVIS